MKNDVCCSSTVTLDGISFSTGLVGLKGRATRVVNVVFTLLFVGLGSSLFEREGGFFSWKKPSRFCFRVILGIGRGKFNASDSGAGSLYLNSPNSRVKSSSSKTSMLLSFSHEQRFRGFDGGGDMEVRVL